MVVLVPAASQAHLGPFIGVLVAGLAVGVFGHIIKSRTLIIIGILMIGLVSVYVSFVLQPGSQ